MALEGIRLSDLYTSKDYNGWLSDETNDKLVKSTIETHPDVNPDNIRGHLYLNAKIKEAIGEEGFSELPTMKLQDKWDWYNNNVLRQDDSDSSEDEPQMPTLESPRDTFSGMQGFMPEPESLEGQDEESALNLSGNLPPLGGTTMRDWFKNNAGGDYTSFEEANRKKIEANVAATSPKIEYFDLPGVSRQGTYTSGETKQLEDELGVMRDTNPDNVSGIKFLENSLKASRQKDDEEVQTALSNLYTEDEFADRITNGSAYYSPVNPSIANSDIANAKTESLSSELRRRFDEDSTFSFDVFKTFEDEMMNNMSYYQYYHDTPSFNFTPNEMKDIMSEYFAVKQIKGPEAAYNFAASVFQDRLAENQSINEKAQNSLKQFGANYLGLNVTTLGFILGIADGVAGAFRKSYDIDDLGWFKEFMYYASDNDIVKYGNRMMTTGTWDPTLQKELEAMGLNQYQLFRKSGEETQLLNANTPFELFSQSAFTAAAMLGSTGIAKVLNNSVGLGTSALATDMLSANAGWLKRAASKAINVLGKSAVVGGTAYFPAVAEATADSMDTYQISKDEAAEAVLMGLQDQLIKEYSDGTYDMWYQQNSRIPYTLPGEVPMTEEQAEELARLREQEKRYLWDTYQRLRQQEELTNPETQKFIETAAQRAAAKNLYDETMFIAFGDALVSNTLGKAFRAAKKGLTTAVTGRPPSKFKWVPDGNVYRPVAQKPGFVNYLKAVANTVVESGEEGIEEGFQTVDTKMRQDLNQHLIAQYIANKYDPESTAVLSDKMNKNFSLAWNSIQNNALSEEAVHSFTIGAVSTFLGSPTVFRGVRTGVETYKKTNKLGSSLWQGLRASWRNPLLENLGEVKVQYLQDQQEANDLNKWISAHPEIETLTDEIGILRFIDQQEQAASVGDEATYRDAVMGQKVATMLMLERANPKGAKAAVYEKLKQISRISETDAEARDLVNQIFVARSDTDTDRTAEGPLNEAEIEALNEAKEKAQNLLRVQKNLKAQLGILESQFQSTISTEAKEALAYSLIMQDDWAERISKINEEAVKAYNDANPDNKVKPIGEEERALKNAIARWGTLANAEEEGKRLAKERNGIRARKGSMYRFEYKAALDENARRIRENNQAIRLLKAEGAADAVITAEEILSLSDKERAYLLDETNRKQYSEAQQKEIKKFITSDGIYNSTINDLIDAGRLQNKKEYFKNEYENLLANSGLIPVFDAEVRKEAAKTWVRAKLSTAMDATTYDEFRDAMDASLLIGEFSRSDRYMLGDIFNEEGTSKRARDFYQKYKKEELERRSLRSIIENSPEFRKLSDSQKEIVNKTVEQVQRSGEEVTTDSIVRMLTDEAYINQLERQGVDVSSIRNAATLEELAQAVERAMKQKQTYDENRKALESKTAQKPKQNPDRTPKPQGKNKVTIIEKKKYESNKDSLNSIFTKIAKNFSNRKKQVLTQDEYLQFISLYTNEPISGELIVDDINTTLSEEGIYETIEKLEAALDNKLYTDEGAKDSPEVQNTIKLIASLKGIINVIAVAQRSGKANITLDSFIKNSIIELVPEMRTVFEKSEKDANLLKDLKNAKFNGKPERVLTTNTEKEWYSKNKIADNLKTLMALRAAKVDYVFLKDSTLESALRTELGEELDNDTLPVVLAARVPANTKGATVGADGYSYLAVGLLQDSRTIPGAEDTNILNAIRNLAMEQEEDGPLMYRGKALVGAWPAPKMSSTTTDKTETTSFRDFLDDKYKDIKDENARKEAVVEDFKKHYRIVTTTTKDGEVKGQYEWNGKVHSISWETTAPDNEKEWPRPVYIRENPDGTVTPLFLEIRRIDEVNFDDAHSMYEALDDESIDITDTKYTKNDGNYVRKSAVNIKNYIVRNRKLLTSKRGSKDFLTKANNPSSTLSIQKGVDRYLNLLKPAGFKVANIGLGLEIEDGNLRLICYDATEKGTSQTVFDIPHILSEIPISDLQGDNLESIQKAAANFAQEGLKNLIFNEDGTIRMADTTGRGTEWPIIKFEDRYAKNIEEKSNAKEKSKVFDEEDVKLKLFGDIWQVRTYAIKEAPEAVSVEMKAQGPVVPPKAANPSNPREEAIKRITADEFLDKNEGKHFEVGPNEMEVTTFIKGGEDDINWSDNSLPGQLATNLGTSMDALYRVWRRDKTQGYEGIVSYMKETGMGSWVGLQGVDGIRRMIKQFERIQKFFEERDEVEVNADLIFRGTIEYNGKYKYLVGKPDIVTVDKDGVYHIYDMKTFRFNSGASYEARGFRGLGFTIKGLIDGKDKVDKWRKQLSLYKAMIESKFGPGSVSEDIGVIPIRLGYKIAGSVDPYVFENTGGHKLKDENGKPLYVSFAAAPQELSPSGETEGITRCFDDVIHMTAITKLTDINPEGWGTAGKAEKVQQSLEASKRAARTASEPKMADVQPVIHKSVQESSVDELLGDLGGEEDPFADPVTQQELQAAGCETLGKA